MAGDTLVAGVPGKRVPPLRVFGTRQLRFGDVLPGVPNSVDYRDANAGRWFLIGMPGAEVDLSFISLPGDLDDGASSALPVCYPTQAGYYTFNFVNAASAFDPQAGTTARLHPFWGFMFVWLGAEVKPTVGQNPGGYKNQIVLDVSYTGN